MFSDKTDEELLSFNERDRASVGIKNIDQNFEHYAGFYVVCANPGVGKGWYALWLIRKFYETSDIKSVYFSLEMSEELVRQRILQAWSDVTDKALKYLIKNKKEVKALNLLKKDIIVVDELGGSDTSHVTTENFVERVKEYYDKGYRAFHFDHLHELDGANDNVRNQGVTEKWAKTFQSLCKDYPDIWLFVYAQPNGASAKKQILKRTDIAGSKAITQKCEFFLSLNRLMKKDEETGELVADNDTRQVTMYIDKNRLSSTQHIGFRLYLLLTGNFSDKQEDDYNDFTKPLYMS
jgi:replicative DNA helicase